MSASYNENIKKAQPRLRWRTVRTITRIDDENQKANQEEGSNTITRYFDKLMDWVDTDSLVTTMIRLYAVSAVMLPPIMAVAYLARSIVELIVR